MKYYYLKFYSAENMNGVVNMHKKSMFNPFVEFWSFLANFGGLETSLEILKTHQIFHRCFIPCICPSEKNLRWYYLIFSSKNLPENSKNF